MTQPNALVDALTEIEQKYIAVNRLADDWSNGDRVVVEKRHIDVLVAGADGARTLHDIIAHLQTTVEGHPFNGGDDPDDTCIELCGLPRGDHHTP